MISKTIKLAYKLCSIPSISGDEAAVLAYVSTYLSEQGFHVERLAVSQGRYNIFAYRVLQKTFSIIFCTHLDTVAPFIKPMLDDDNGILWGRGSCDAKGIAAAMIAAVLAECDAGHDDLALLFTVGEEEASDGAKACAEKLAGRGRFLVVGEPTELRAASAQKGSLVFDLSATGIEAHSSQPELGDSALHKLVHDINRLISVPWPEDAQYGKTLLNFGMIEGGHMRNMVAPTARAKAIMRTSMANQPIIDQIRGALSAGVALEIFSSVDPFLFHAPVGFSQFLAAFGSDVPYLRGVGTPMLIGPGSLLCAHRPNEHMCYADIDAGVQAYRRIAQGARSA